MSKSFYESDLEKLDKLYHELYFKMSHSNYLDNYPLLKELSTLEMSVLGTLTRFPNIIPSDIAKELAISKSTLTNVINRLEKRKYVYREISSHDRRSFELKLTQNGKEAQKQHTDSERMLYFKTLSAFNENDEVKNFLNLLEKIIHNF